MLLDASGNGGLGPTDVDDSSNDACGVDSLILSPSSFSCLNLGTVSVSLDVIDNNGNGATCTANVDVGMNPLAFLPPPSPLAFSASCGDRSLFWKCIFLGACT